MALKYLIRRPIAIFSLFTSFLIAGIVFFGKIPISLLPAIDVPEIIIHINYKNAAAANIEQSVIAPLRSKLANIDNIRDIETQCTNHSGIIRLIFQYGTRMDLAIIQINEELDRLQSRLPKDFERPQVNRITTADIPILRLQILPKNESQLADLSELALKTLKRRLEQVEGAGMVDLNGGINRIITITPKESILSALGLTHQDLSRSFEQSERQMGQLSVKDGQYTYNISLEENIVSLRDIASLMVVTPTNHRVALEDLAEINYGIEKPNGMHLFNGRRGIVITIQKQPDSRMNDVIARLDKVILQFKKDYPSIDFEITQNQSYILEAGIDNLYQDLFLGGLLTIALLFLLLSDWQSCLIMVVTIPISLIITFIFFYLFKLSLNIISLSGLTLGIGMLIDNAIVVIDNIDKKRKRGFSLVESCVEGTNEVVTPVISQVLTTVAVYAPLIILNSLAGSLVNDQSIALTISLGVSLLVAFILCPTLYSFLGSPNKPIKSIETRPYRYISRKYHQMIGLILNHRSVFFIITILLMPIGFIIATAIPIKSLPKIENTEGLLTINWNEPINLEENRIRVSQLGEYITSYCVDMESEIGVKDFTFTQDLNSANTAELFYKCRSLRDREFAEQKIRLFFKTYPKANLKLKNAPNAFTQLFEQNGPDLEIRFKAVNLADTVNEFKYAQLMKTIGKRISFISGQGNATQKSLQVFIDKTKLNAYGLREDELSAVLNEQFGVVNISQLKRFGELTQVQLKSSFETFKDKLNARVITLNNQSYPLSALISWNFSSTSELIQGDKKGVFQSIIPIGRPKDIENHLDYVKQSALANGYYTDFQGQYFQDKQQINSLWMILIIVLVLLYVILVIQYENMVLPVIVMLTIPLGITGSMFLLWVTGGTINVMSAIGFIVILGLIVDDPILKIETLENLWEDYHKQGFIPDEELLKRMIHEAGERCLKPLLLVSLTTSIVMVPVLIFGGLGNELQRPLAIVIIGGLTVGTFFTTWFIPLAYWQYKTLLLKRKKNYHEPQR